MGVNKDVKETIIRRDIVGVNMVSSERRFLFIDKISSSSRLGSNFIYWTRVLLLIELQVTQRMISEA